MEPSKKTSSKCGDVLHKGSSFLSFISLLLIVALFLRMESINRKTEMNEMQISKVESRIQTELLQTTDHKNDMETLESRYKRTVRFHHHFCLCYLMRCFVNIFRCYLFQVRMHVNVHFEMSFKIRALTVSRALTEGQALARPLFLTSF